MGLTGNCCSTCSTYVSEVDMNSQVFTNKTLAKQKSLPIKESRVST